MPEDFAAAMIRSAVAAGVALPAPAMRLLDTASPNAIPDALKALGLSLRATRAPLDVLVVDSMEKTPTDNELQSARTPGLVGDHDSQHRQGTIIFVSECHPH